MCRFKLWKWGGLFCFSWFSVTVELSFCLELLLFGVANLFRKLDESIMNLTDFRAGNLSKVASLNFVLYSPSFSSITKNNNKYCILRCWKLLRKVYCDTDWCVSPPPPHLSLSLNTYAAAKNGNRFWAPGCSLTWLCYCDINVYKVINIDN